MRCRTVAVRTFLSASLPLAVQAQVKTPATQAQIDSLRAKISVVSSAVASISTTLSRMGGAKHDTAVITRIVIKPETVFVVAPRDTTPSVIGASAPSLACPNEPAGYTTITTLNDVPVWPAPNLTGWIDDARNATKALSVVTDPMAPVAGGAIGGLFPAGMSGGGAPFYIYRPFAVTEQFRNLYICGYVKHDTDFDNTNGNTGSKFLWPSADQVQGTMTYTGHDGSTMEFALFQQGVVDRFLHANVSPSTVASLRGTWVRYELLFRGSSSNSTADGGLDIWIGGRQTHHYTDVRYQMNPARTWLSLAWNPTYGGGLNPVLHDQRQYLNGLRVSGSNR